MCTCFAEIAHIQGQEMGKDPKEKEQRSSLSAVTMASIVIRSSFSILESSFFTNTWNPFGITSTNSYHLHSEALSPW